MKIKNIIQVPVKNKKHVKNVHVFDGCCRGL